MLIVTHEMEFALAVSDRIVFMEQGRIQASASPEEICANNEAPALQRIRQFMGVKVTTNQGEIPLCR